jgi:hypothetical protein
LIGSEFERHLDALARRLAEVQDPAHAALQAGVLDGVDGADAALVAHRRRDLVVVAARRLDVVMDALDSRVGKLLGARGGDVPDGDAALEVRLLGDESRPLEDLREVALGQPLALGDHAEAVRPGRLRRPGVLEDLLGLHHRVHRRVGLGVARLGAEPAVLGAATRLRVDQRAHVCGVAEALLAHGPRALDKLGDLVAIAHPAQLERFVEGDQGRHPIRPLLAHKLGAVSDA